MSHLTASRVIAVIAFIPFCVLASPVVFYTDWRWGRGSLSARKAQQDMMENNWLLKPFMWAHRNLCCRGDARLQRW